MGGLTARGRSPHASASPGALAAAPLPRARGRAVPRSFSFSLPTSAPPAARGRRRLPGARLTAPERRRWRAAEAGLTAAMDRFVWTSGLLEINETLVIQQRGVRIYDGEEKVGRRSALPVGARPGWARPGHALGPRRPRPLCAGSSAWSPPAGRGLGLAPPPRRPRATLERFPAGADCGHMPPPPRYASGCTERPESACCRCAGGGQGQGRWTFGLGSEL